MFPFQDINPTQRTPVVTYLLVAINVLVFLYMLGLQGYHRQVFVGNYGIIPYEFFKGNLPESNAISPALSGLTSMFLHGGFMHIAGNMLYLWVFGDNVEERLGHFRFLLFYLVGGLAAAACQIVAVYFAAQSAGTLEPMLVPTIGASGAVAAVLGAYLHWWPRARVRTLVILIVFVTVIELPAIFVLGWWFVLQLLRGVGSLNVVSLGGVAWWAHIGGFVFGYLVAVRGTSLLRKQAFARHRRTLN